MMKTIAGETATIWSGKSPLEATKERLWGALIPQSGSCLTSHGELLRAVGRIYYDRNNNGFGNGPFKAWDKVICNHYDQISEYMVHCSLRDFLEEFCFINYGEDVVPRDWTGDKSLEELIKATICAVEKMDAQYQGYRKVDDIVADLNSGEDAKRNAALAFMKEKITSRETDPDIVKELALVAVTGLGKVSLAA